MTLHEYVARALRTPFAPGRHDCARFVAGWVALQTGVDPMRGWRYRTVRGGMQALRRRGFASLADAVSAHLPEAPRARPGDVVLIDGEALGIAAGEHAYCVGEDGLKVVTMARASRFWRVG
jgi:hypothetical protein